MEALLQEALDDFDEAPAAEASAQAATCSSQSGSMSPSPAPSTSPPPSANLNPPEPEAEEIEAALRSLAASAEKLSSEGDGAEEEALLAQLLHKLSGGSGESAEQQMMELLSQMSGLEVEPGEGESEASAKKSSVEGGAQAAANDGNGTRCGGEAVASALEAMKDDSAMDGLFDTLVGQLLSKDVMLEPMQHLHAEFPKYLEANSASLSPADQQRYRKQQELVGRILDIYEKAPEDTDSVAALMQVSGIPSTSRGNGFILRAHHGTRNVCSDATLG